MVLRIFICALVFCGCATFSGQSSRPEGDVVERSKQSRPVWADAPNAQLVVNATEAKVHVELLKQKDLPIAIKTAQATAIEASYLPWKPSFETRMKEFQGLQASRNGRNEAEYQAISEQVARKVHAQVAHIEDIYYERILLNPAGQQLPEFQGLTEYFDVHVLVQLLPVESPKLQSIVYQMFSMAKSPELKRSVKMLGPSPARK